MNAVYRVLGGKDWPNDLRTLEELGWWDPAARDLISRLLVNLCFARSTENVMCGQRFPIAPMPTVHTSVRKYIEEKTVLQGKRERPALAEDDDYMESNSSPKRNCNN